MKFKMAENSLFAILMRNPWWISLLIVIVFCLLCVAILPKDLRIFGMMGTFPFFITGAVAFKRQWGKPSAAKLQTELERLSALSWRDFSTELEAKFVKQGFEVTRLDAKSGAGVADFKLEKAGHITLVSAKRYKAATHGLEALQALVAQQEAQSADKAMYVCLSPVTAQAAKFAKEKGLVLGWVS
jgi:restriction system protein